MRTVQNFTAELKEKDHFQREYCNTINYLSNDLQEFNVAMQDIDCETVYDASSDVGDDDGYVPPMYRVYSLLVKRVAFDCITIIL
mmetsp:Transcript_50887/g.61248  ORF Transcript_50887/g.61248 Transcript_50887/m.61248 type:complete len:85 (+) Transcript_50887:41-295(+)